MEHFLQDVLRIRLVEDQWHWLQAAVQEATTTAPQAGVLRSYRDSARRVGKRALALTAEEKKRLTVLNPLLSLDHWGADEAARAEILLAAAHLPAGDFAKLVQDCYQFGDSREQQSWLKALCLLPQPERFLDTAIDSCRTNILPLFESIAAENPYPSVYFPERNFNQMVMKCLFNGIRVARIVGLESRLNAQLARMATDYAAEREAAGRPVPPDLGTVIATPRAVS